MVNEFKARRDLVVKGLNEIEGISCFLPKGAFYTFFKIDFGMSSKEFNNYLLERGRLVFTSGSAFGSGGEGFIRMSYAASRENLTKGLNKLAETVKSIQK